jgi:hypothetical protein
MLSAFVRCSKASVGMLSIHRACSGVTVVLRWYYSGVCACVCVCVCVCVVIPLRNKCAHRSVIQEGPQIRPTVSHHPVSRTPVQTK